MCAATLEGPRRSGRPPTGHGEREARTRTRRGRNELKVGESWPPPPPSPPPPPPPHAATATAAAAAVAVSVVTVVAAATKRKRASAKEPTRGRRMDCVASGRIEWWGCPTPKVGKASPIQTLRAAPPGATLRARLFTPRVCASPYPLPTAASPYSSSITFPRVILHLHVR